MPRTIKSGRKRIIKAWACAYPDGVIAHTKIWKGLFGIFDTQKDCNEMGFEGVEVEIKIIGKAKK